MKQTIPDAVCQVITNSDIVLCILDARYIADTRNLYIEEKIREMNKKIIYVLNKSDLAFHLDRNEMHKLSPRVLLSCVTRRGVNELRDLIKKQWEENRAVTGGHQWDPPEWCDIDPDGCPLPPFRWDEDRRAVLKAELDATYAKLYGLTIDELRYILDPQDVYGSDFPGETFRVLKEKEIRNYGEYRTRRLVLEAWERLNQGEL